MSDVELYDDGMKSLESYLKKYAQKASTENVLDTMEKGAKEFVKDLLMLPKPRRQIQKPGYRTSIFFRFIRSRFSWIRSVLYSDTSRDTTCPVSPANSAARIVLPPGAAHRSMTVLPG